MSQDDPSRTPSIFLRRISTDAVVVFALPLLAAIAVGLLLEPTGNKILRSLLLASIGLIWLGVLFLIRRQKVPARIFLAATLLVASIPLLPGRAIDPSRLRTAYLKRLAEYTGTRYVWGGENYRGIDCSGLVRGSFRDACLIEGLSSMNPRLIREGLQLWWYDCSARAMGEGYRGLTTRFALSATLNDLDHAQLIPGDIAVTENGVHTLAYLGDHEWIQADPGQGIVRRSRVPEDSFWYKVPVVICRWGLIEGASR